MVEYARSVAVYREIREALDPWCKANGYRRVRGSEPCWVRPLSATEELSVCFRSNRWGSGATGGNSFYGLIQRSPVGVIADASNISQSDISHCLSQTELDELREIQTVINRRRPRTPELEAWMREDSRVGEHTRQMYSGNEQPYTLGDFVTFGYYSLDDVRAHTAFLAKYMPQALVRFEAGGCVKPKPQPMPPGLARIFGSSSS